METIERILAGRALLGNASGSTTAGVRELLRPETVTEDPTTDKDVEQNLVLPCVILDQYAGSHFDLADRMNVARGNLHVTYAAAREGMRDWTQYSTAIFSGGHDFTTQGGFGMAGPTPHGTTEHVRWVGLWNVDVSVVEPLSPFEQVTSLSYAHIERLIESVGNAFQVRYAGSLRTRLVDLLANWREEHELSEAPSPESLSGLLRFLSSDLSVQFPSIVLSPNGTWVAEWRLDSRNLFSAHFLDEANTRFVAVVASSKSPKRKPNQVWGEIELGKLLATLQAYGADRWVCE